MIGLLGVSLMNALVLTVIQPLTLPFHVAYWWWHPPSPSLTLPLHSHFPPTPPHHLATTTVVVSKVTSLAMKGDHLSRWKDWSIARMSHMLLHCPRGCRTSLVIRLSSLYNKEKTHGRTNISLNR